MRTSSPVAPTSIECVLMHPSLPSGRQSGTLTASQRCVEASYGEETLSLPIRGLEVSCGGANNTLYFLSHPEHEGWSIFTRDKGILDLLRSLGDSNLNEHINLLGRERRGRMRGAFYAVLVILAIIWAIAALRNPVVGFVADLIPRSWERTLGETVYVGIRAQTPIIDDSELTSDLEKILAPLTKVAEESGYKFDFHISRDQDLNAFALPGGILVVNSGTILNAGRPEELLGVMAHEMSHVTRRHTTRQVVTVFGLYMIVDFMFGNIFGTVAAISQGAMYLLQQGFSREHEHEADVSGLEFLEKAQIDPMGMVEFFQRIKTEQEKTPVVGALDSSLSFLSTHPATGDRIQYLTDRIKSSGSANYKPVPTEEFEKLKTKLRAKF